VTATLSGNDILNVAAGFTEPLDWDIRKKDGVTALALNSGDVVHFELYASEGGTQLLSIDNSTPSANGSSVSITTRGVNAVTPASGLVTLDEDDTASLYGRKYFVLWYADSGDSNRKKIFRRGQLNFLKR
jgi:large exoprotein involved in heme utilization and adhesion